MTWYLWQPKKEDGLKVHFYNLLLYCYKLIKFKFL
jgi:hypothetical protein